jgi:hypothetical protein
MNSTAYDELHPTEQNAYQRFIADEPLLASDLVLLSVEDFLYWASGWYTAARECFAEGALESIQMERPYGWAPKNPYPSAEHVLYDCNENYTGADAYFRVDPNTLKPRARQWHLGYLFGEAQ